MRMMRRFCRLYKDLSTSELYNYAYYLEERGYLSLSSNHLMKKYPRERYEIENQILCKDSSSITDQELNFFRLIMAILGLTSLEYSKIPLWNQNLNLYFSELIQWEQERGAFPSCCVTIL